MSTRPAKRLLDLKSVMEGRQKSLLIGQPEGLESVCFLLNSKEPVDLCSGLRRLVRDWQLSGPNLAKMLRDNKALAVQVRHGRTLLVPTESGKGHLLWLPNPSNVDVISWKGQALAHFMDLIVNPQWNRLGGPCQRCDRFYVKKTSRQKKYCSRQCGTRMTALAATRKRREEERTNKLSCVQAAVYEWTTVEIRVPWKDWVSSKTKVTVKWLTRALNKGDLKAPIKNRTITKR